MSAMVEQLTRPRGRTYRLKLALVGDVGVGKTSLVHRFVYGEFEDRYVSTIGAKVNEKHLDVRKGEPGGPAILDVVLWDVMGMESFMDFMGEAYFTGAHGIIAVCDLTRPETLRDLDQWVERAKGLENKIPICVLANKADMSRERRISDADLEIFCSRRGWSYFVTSAKTGDQVGEALEKLCMKALRSVAMVH